MLLRTLSRFVSVYGVFPRGYGKTLIEVLGMYVVCILYPDIEVAMTAQTKENAAGILEEKHREIVKFYPLINNEISKASFSKDTAEIVFTSGGRIDILVNNQSSKGKRRKRINVEEAALLNNALFDDVLEPIVNVPRRTVGKEAKINPEELNGQINFFTTSGFRNSEEFERNVRMIDEMAELKGVMVLGAGWQLAVGYGRGESKAQLLSKKAKVTPTFFAQNYESKWTGAHDGALINITKLMSLRTLTRATFENKDDSEIILAVDVARSESTNNNQSSIAVLRLERNKIGKVKNIQLINLIHVPNFLNFDSQAIEIKRIKNIYKAKIIVVDSNGLGIGLVDCLLKEHTDPLTGEYLGCYDTINTENKPESEDAEKIVYALMSQAINSDIIVCFIDMVESSKLQLLEKRINANYDVEDLDYIKNNVVPFIQTDILIEEIANLRMEKLPSNKLTVKQTVKRIDKDKYSALAYGLYYIKMFEDNTYSMQEEDIMLFID